MVKFGKETTKLKPKVKSVVLKGREGGALKVKKNATTVTFEGAKAYKSGDKTALFNLAVVNMVGEDTFYETASVRDNRFIQLIHTVTAKDPQWVASFVPYLRNEMFMRSASIVVAAEYAASGGPNARKVINDALQRADEPAEFLAYWMQKYYGWDTTTYPLPAPKLPQSVRKGLGDAVRRLYNEYSVMKYNGLSRGVAIGNVLNLVHPSPKDDKQGLLFQYIIDRHHRNESPVSSFLTQIKAFNELNILPADEREERLSSEALKEAGMTWESLSAWGPMDAKRWEMIIPSMGYMALLRNLRNFEQAGIAKSSIKFVIDKLTDPDEVAKSKQFPFRFLSAYKNTGSLLWASALEQALDLSVSNIPVFSGSTQVYVDLSGSMQGGGWNYGNPQAASAIEPWEIGALFGLATYYRQNSDVEFIAWASTSEKLSLPKGGSVLKGIEKIRERINHYGGGTNLQGALQAHYKDADRIVIFSDFQTQHMVTKKVKNLHAFNLGGYDATPLQIGIPGIYGYSGFSDKTFSLMKVLEETGSGTWPFLP